MAAEAVAPIYVIVPEWKYPNNLGALLRTVAILGGYVVVPTLSGRQRRTVLRYASQTGMEQLVETDDIAAHIRTHEKVYVLECMHTWESFGIEKEPTSVFNTEIAERGSTAVLVGHEETGVNLDILQFLAFIPAFIPQSPVKSGRGLKVSLNMQQSVAIALSALRTRSLMGELSSSSDPCAASDGSDPCASGGAGAAASVPAE